MKFFTRIGYMALALVTLMLEAHVEQPNPLFEAYPALALSIPHCHLGNLPTPVQQLNTLGTLLNVPNLWIKRDDLSGNPFGGNKVRKLEFLLADAIAKGYRGIFTRGFAGSNHVCATALYAHLCGLECVCLLGMQRNTSYLQRNLKLDYYWGAEQHFIADYEDDNSRNGEIARLNSLHYEKTGTQLYNITSGGSDLVGTLGFVNAAFELKQQIDKGLLPEPDYIYTALGSCGTAAGLMLGLRAAGLKSVVIPICIEDEESPTHAAKLITLVQGACNNLIKADPTFPRIVLTEKDFAVSFDFVGKGYAAISAQTHDAVKLLWETEGIKLDGTYTGKTFAALLHDVNTRNIKDKVILFWDTFCSGSFDDIVSKIPYTALPKEFHFFYEMPLEEGDQGV
ncbi:TPA: hypothetical protein DDZ86_01155 [Candidatus Dependentiae bacterium]|nr:MAG: 1-aminocyclopropane-1-carboxylate deaminase [candidate division TM6 bacterium GW2011_GWF2_43_87]HBL98234.1 hypothetical protein [Candidatus Dependentiae bacterium]